MASKEWTQEQRERAAEQVWKLSGRELDDPLIYAWKIDVLSSDPDPYSYGESLAVNIQCELNEARELLMFAEFTDSEHLTRYGRWLSRNK